MNENTNKTGGFDGNFLRNYYYDGVNKEKLEKSLWEIKKIAEGELNCKLIHLAIAWVLKFEYTSTALFGARNVAQLMDILDSLEVLDKLTPEMEGKINKIMDTNPTPRTNFRTWKPYPPIRPVD